ncbi:MAG TPA: 4Fe-4S dicluster domain-containing protein [Anaeromyxobacteraceae bacterium]|nr:4Fe-4S dicluster domain-containing protein [Anaeromyxobacteraceae bacterium]
MKLSRRGFLQVAGIAGTAALAMKASRAQASSSLDERGEGECGMLVDTTLCAGCRACEAACAESNGLPPPVPDVDIKSVRRDTAPEAFTVVNGFPGEGRDGADRFAKRQCMHCIEPACASACPVRALDKQPGGPVIYRGERCMGCRYCMVACPFEIPKYQYDKLAPLVRKCTFCAKRQAEGKKPACAEACPTGALMFGKRGSLLEMAKGRIYRNPDQYFHHVYGEHEAGGTDWLYISDVPFKNLAFPVVRDEPYPDKVQGALGAPPFVMTLWPPLLMGLYAFSKRRDGEGEKAAKHQDPHDTGSSHE